MKVAFVWPSENPSGVVSATVIVDRVWLDPTQIVAGAGVTDVCAKPSLAKKRVKATAKKGIRKTERAGGVIRET